MSNEKQLPCAVVRDLLSLHEDALCGEETSALIDAHLAECEDCRAGRDAIRMAVPAAPAENGDSLTAVRKTYRSIRVRTLLIAVLVGVLVFGGLVAAGDYLSKPFVYLTPDELDIAELYVTTGGKVIFCLDTSQYNRFSHSGITLQPDWDTGTITLQMTRPHWPYARKVSPAEQQAFLKEWTADPYMRRSYFDMEIVDGTMIYHMYSFDDTISDVEVKEVRIGDDKGNYKTIWKVGDPIDTIPSEIVDW